MKIPVVPFLPLVRKKYRTYGMHVLGHRHFAEGRDGMTPVQRRSVWTLGNELGAFDKSHTVKTARAAGDCLGKFHPHEVSSVVGAMTGISQSRSAAPLVMGIGNWGSWEDPPSAERYTSCYLSKYAKTFFDPDELTQVPFDDSYDGDRKEPRFLPAPLPHLLLQGCTSFGVAARGDVPPCTLDWVVNALSLVIDKKPVPLPKSFAYRWGGKLVSLDRQWLTNGTGVGTFRPTVRVDETNRTLTLTSLAPRFNVYSFLSSLEKEEAFGGFLSEPSGNDLVSITILLKRGHNFAALKKAVSKRISSRVNYAFLYIEQLNGADDVEFRPRTVGPVEFLRRWVDWRSTVVAGAAKHRISNLEKDSNRQRLLIRVIDKRRQILTALDQSKDYDDQRVRIRKILSCSAEDADIVRQIQLYRLASLEVASLKQKIADNDKKVTENRRIVAKPSVRLLADASSAKERLVETLQEAAELGDVSKDSGGKRRQRRRLKK